MCMFRSGSRMRKGFHYLPGQRSQVDLRAPQLGTPHTRQHQQVVDHLIQCPGAQQHAVQTIPSVGVERRTVFGEQHAAEAVDTAQRRAQT
jgi:hypothetical protein